MYRPNLCKTILLNGRIMKNPLNELMDIIGTGNTYNLEKYNLISDNLSIIPHRQSWVKREYHLHQR